MTTNEVQDTLLEDDELQVKVIRDALYIHKLWFKDGNYMPRYLAKLEELCKRYEDKEYTVGRTHTLLIGLGYRLIKQFDEDWVYECVA